MPLERARARALLEALGSSWRRRAPTEASLPELALPAAASWSFADVSLSGPFWRAFELLGGEHAFLLDSARADPGLGDFSYFGADPIVTLRAYAGPRCRAPIELTIHLGPEGAPLKIPRKLTLEGDPFEILRALQARLHVSRPEHAPAVPFLAGAVGWFGYEAVRHLEDVPLRDSGAPELCWMFFDQVVSHDHRTGRTMVSAISRRTDRATASHHSRLAAQALARSLEEGAAAGRTEPPVKRAEALGLRRDFDEAGYAAQVERARQHILAGDVFEVCLSQRFEAALPALDPYALYEALRQINPAPFSAFLRLPELAVVSASPERFLSLDARGHAESRPIKGTRPRGATEAEDRALELSLATSAKDRAENVMIVDLVRNDLGRVCKIGSVHVPELAIVERYATVFQLVSTVRGVLEEGLGAIDLVRAAFPGGSMTGAPKLESIRIIDALEPVPRGVYSGGLGFLDHSGAMQLAMVIRTAIVTRDRVSFHTGGAVVSDSDPAAEHRETLDKARALIDALHLVAGRGAP